MKKIFALLLLPLSLWALPAFPGAEGYGSETPGGRGGKIYMVTNLNSSGPGSFRAALLAKEPRIIVFRVSGVIDITGNGDDDMVLEDSLHSYFTIAGQTSPGGITITGSNQCSNVIWQYAANKCHDEIWRFIRFRADSITGDHAFEHYRSSRFILDHCDFSGGLDEAVDICRSNNFTIQWSTINNSSPYAYKTPGSCSSSNPTQAYGMLLSYGPMWHITMHHNMFANHNKRGPEMGLEEVLDSGKIDFRNNVVYNIAQYTSAFWGYDSTQYYAVNVVGNYYRSGPMSPASNPVTASALINLHTSGNYWDTKGSKGAPYAGDPDTVVWNAYGRSPKMMATEWPLAPVTTHTAVKTYDTVLARAGAWPRDSQNVRTVQDIVNRTGRMGEMDEPYIVKGPKPPTDSDMDGMPDYWERAVGLNPNSASDANGDFDQSGYTNIEKYINDLANVLIGSAPVYPNTKIDSVKAGVYEYGYVKVIVTDSATGAPLRDVCISVNDTTSVILGKTNKTTSYVEVNSAITGSTGECIFREDAAAYTVSLKRSQYRIPAKRIFTIAKGETTTVRIALAPYGASSISLLPAKWTLGLGRTKQISAYRTFPDQSILPLTDSVKWSSVPAGLVTVSKGGIVTGVAVGNVTLIGDWVATGFKDTVNIQVVSSAVIVDFGATVKQNVFGLSGWDSLVADAYNSYTDKGPGGTWSFSGYGHAGACARDTNGHGMMFVSGDTIVVSWYNNLSTPVSFTPNICFNNTGRSGSGKWSAMSAVTLTALGSGESRYVFDGANAGSYYIVNVSQGYTPPSNNVELVCDKIALKFAASDIGVEQNVLQPGLYSALQVVPNPFNSRVSIRAPRFAGTEVPELVIVDIQGRSVSRLHQPHAHSFQWEFIWDAGSLPPGVYFASCKTGKMQLRRKLMRME
ncbi:MAG: Ig-like domain-containing protein [Fibrobacteres bacterium]|nr:Ig-like domain-containing protein [Fibrobacterota bacterium]